MSRRNLSYIQHGWLDTYDTFPHNRAWLAWMRDSALNDTELDRVADIADKFDAEDQAWLDAGRIVQSAQGLGGTRV